MAQAALLMLSKRPAAGIAGTFGIHERRARTTPAGAVVLAAVQRRLGVPLVVSRTGLREGAARASRRRGSIRCVTSPGWAGGGT